MLDMVDIYKDGLFVGDLHGTLIRLSVKSLRCKRSN